MSTWKCLQYALVCSLGSHTFKWLVGWCIYRPQLNSSRWRKAVALRHIGQSDGDTGQSGAPVRSTYPLDLTTGGCWRCRLLHRTVCVTLDNLVTSLHQCHQELSVGLQFPGAPDCPVCHRTVCPWWHISSFLGLCLILVDLHLWSS
jgi:hypothetical protein